MRGLDWVRVELAIIVTFHLVAGVTIAFAPRSQVITTGTLPVFEILPSLLTADQARVLWAALYVAAGACAALLLARFSITRQVVTWLTVAFIGFSWAGTFGLAVLNGEGSAIGLVVWVVLLLWWTTVAVRIGLGGTGDQCGPS